MVVMLAPAPGVPAPKLTVLIPTRNRFGLLRAQVDTIHLLLGKYGARFEIVVHDNSTFPAPDDLLEAFPPSVNYQRSPELFDTAEENIAAALTHCLGEYIWLLADDDGVEPDGLELLLQYIEAGKEDILVFNSRHGRDERLSDEGAYVTERSRRFFHGREMRCSLRTFVQRTGYFYWICGISTLIIRRSIASPEVLRKYVGIARIYAHVAWLIEVGKDRQFVFVNRPLVVYGLLPTDHDGGRHWRNVAIREGGYSTAVWTGLWLRVLDELVRIDALSVDEVRHTVDMSHQRRFHFGSNLTYQVLEQLSNFDELPPVQELAIMRRWIMQLLPGALFLLALLDEILRLTQELEASLTRIACDSGQDPTKRLVAKDLQERAEWWRRAIASTPWYVRFYVETFQFYDIYNFGDDWVAAHVSFGDLAQALEVIDLPSFSPGFLRASSYKDLVDLIEEQPLHASEMADLRKTALTLPGQWNRLGVEREQAQVHVEVQPAPIVAPPASTIVPLPAPAPSTQASERDEEVDRLREALARREAQLSAVFSTTSWRLTGPLRRLRNPGWREPDLSR